MSSTAADARSTGTAIPASRAVPVGRSVNAAAKVIASTLSPTARIVTIRWPPTSCQTQGRISS
jgi:hypothetical protein